MIGWLQRWSRRHPSALIALAALVLSLRVVGAETLGPAPQGWIPICTGTEIAYVAVDADGAPLAGLSADRDGAPDGGAPPSKACDFIGLVAALTPEAPVAPPPPAPAVLRPVAQGEAQHAPAAPNGFESRAPPVFA